MKRIAISMICLSASLSLVASASPGEAMGLAAASYDRGDHERASLIWEGLRTKGYASPVLFFNLGNAYFQMEEWGRAVLNYERALSMQPGNQKIRHNLGLAMERVEGDPLTWPEAALVYRWRVFRGKLSSNAWALAGLAACWMAAAAFGWGRLREKAWPWMLAAVVGVAAAALAWLFAFSSSRALDTDFAVVLSDRLAVYVGPDAQSGEAAVAFEGWKVRQLDRIGDWIKVEMADGQEGWVRAGGVEGL